MPRYLLQRLLQMVPVLLLVSVIVFTITQLLPGDLAQAVLGEGSAGNSAAYEQVRTELGLDDPLPVRYIRWLGRAAQGDLGTSYRTHEPVSAALRSRLPRTLELGLLGLLVSVAIGIPLGVLAAARANGWIDRVSTVIAIGGVAIPDFWLGLMLIYFFAYVLQIFPGTGWVDPSENLGENLKHLALPAVILGTAGCATLMRQTRSSMIEVLQQDYIRTAVAKGLTSVLVLLRHALRNALVPVLTVLGLQVGRLLGGAVVVETVFGVPGIGSWAAESIFFRDFAAIQAVILLLAAVVLLTNLVTDLLYARLDPRIGIR